MRMFFRHIFLTSPAPPHPNARLPHARHCQEDHLMSICIKHPCGGSLDITHHTLFCVDCFPHVPFTWPHQQREELSTLVSVSLVQPQYFGREHHTQQMCEIIRWEKACTAKGKESWCISYLIPSQWCVTNNPNTLAVESIHLFLLSVCELISGSACVDKHGRCDWTCSCTWVSLWVEWGLAVLGWPRRRILISPQCCP